MQFWYMPPQRDYLKQAKIETLPLFYPSHTLPHCATKQSFPVESLAARGINLPSYPGLERNDVDVVIDAIRSFFNEVRA
jgi:perosamine synthetase